MQSPPLRVGTDCSGMEAPIQALRKMGIPFEHVFASEIDTVCLQTIRANTSPSHLYEGDIRERDHSSVPPVDLYVCGFPCQPFSKVGEGKGLSDPRGTVFFACAEYIRAHRPLFFVLENVITLLTNDEGRTWRVILSTLTGLDGYSVSFSVMNTRDYGVPQSRRRLYIVGRRGEEPFVFPPPVSEECPPVESIVDWEDTTPPSPRGTFLKRALDLSPLLQERGSCFVDILQYRSRERIPARGFKHATCLLTTSYVWCVPMRRWASHLELLRMQGFPDDFRIVVRDSEFRKQIGNTMSVNVLQTLFESLLSRAHTGTG